MHLMVLKNRPGIPAEMILSGRKNKALQIDIADSYFHWKPLSLVDPCPGLHTRPFVHLVYKNGGIIVVLPVGSYISTHHISFINISLLSYYTEKVRYPVLFLIYSSCHQVQPPDALSLFLPSLIRTISATDIETSPLLICTLVFRYAKLRERGLCYLSYNSQQDVSQID